MSGPRDPSLSEEELRNEVVHRSNRGESDRRIAMQLGISRWKVRKIIDLYQKARGDQQQNEPSPQPATPLETIPPSLGRPIQKRDSKLDAFEPQLQQLMDRYPRITVVRLQEELQSAGYRGGYRPWACQVRRPQTKGKVERPFYYIEMNLLNGRQFRSLQHLNESARWWLAEVADKRIHGTTKKTPLELHTEELPHLLALPSLQFDTAQVVYRIVDTDGTIQLVVYNRSLLEMARHALVVGQIGQRRTVAGHLPPKDHEAQMNAIRERYATLGEVAIQFLDGILAKTRYSKHHAQKVLTLLNIYPKSDVLAAMQRAVTYRAFGYSSLERILAHQGTPKPSWQQLSESEQEPQEDNQEPRSSGDDTDAHGDAQDQDASGGT